MTTKKQKPRARRGSGSIKKEANGLYSVRYYDNGRQVRAPQQFTDREAAELWNSERLVATAKGQWQDPRRSSELLRVFGERELQARTYTPLSRQAAEWQWARYIEPAFGDWPLNKIRLQDVEEWRTRLLANGIGARSVEVTYNTLKSLMRAAVEKDKISKNPCRVKVPQPRPAKRAHVSYEQCMTVASLLLPHLQPLAQVAWWSAARRGEVLGLQWRDVDLTTGETHIRRQIVQVGTELHETRPKWHSDRIITLPKPGLEILRQHRATVERSATDQRIFLNIRGDDLTPHALGLAWRKARTRAGLPHVAFHDLRRSSATAMLEAGMTVYEIMLWLGHQEITTTQRYLMENPTARPARAALFAAYVTRLDGSAEETA